MNYDYQYEDLMAEVRNYGREKSDRTGTGTISMFGGQMRFALADSFPLITTKKVHLKSIITELLWFLRGDTNTAYLKEHGCRIWNEWEDAQGNLGPVYGKQWRNWQGADGRFHDQIANVMETLKCDPDSRRIIVSAWNVGELDQMALMPCHAFFQFYTEKMNEGEKKLYARVNPGMPVPELQLSCQLYQRSADLLLGVPFNIASYSLLTMMIAQQLGLGLGEFIWTGGDMHIYKNHIEQVDLQLSREAPCSYPTMRLVNKPADLYSYSHDNFVLEGYTPEAAIKAPVAV